MSLPRVSRLEIDPAILFCRNEELVKNQRPPKQSKVSKNFVHLKYIAIYQIRRIHYYHLQEKFVLTRISDQQVLEMHVLAILEKVCVRVH